MDQQSLHIELCNVVSDNFRRYSEHAKHQIKKHQERGLQPNNPKQKCNSRGEQLTILFIGGF